MAQLEFWNLCPVCSNKNPVDYTICNKCFSELNTSTQQNKKIDMTQLKMAIDKYDHDKRIENNYLEAYNHIPESLCTINMLYFKGTINNVLLNIFVDTGAQMTIMSRKTAKKCQLEHLIDTRYEGEARGVGTQKITGKIHLAELLIDDQGLVLPCSFTILDKQDIDVIFGLDMLLSHGIILNLKNKTMNISGINIPFINVD